MHVSGSLFGFTSYFVSSSGSLRPLCCLEHCTLILILYAVFKQCSFLFVFQTLKPDPILSLKRVVGFGGGTFREVNLFSLDGKHFSFSELFALLLDVFK